MSCCFYARASNTDGRHPPPPPTTPHPAAAGLGDVAVPGLLACLALRYDASRCVDLRARGAAVASAVQQALDLIDVSSRGGGRVDWRAG